jgi:hypothetical protein
MEQYLSPMGMPSNFQPAKSSEMATPPLDIEKRCARRRRSNVALLPHLR